MRVNVSLEDKLVEMIDNNATRLGLSRSSLMSMLISISLNNNDVFFEVSDHEVLYNAVIKAMGESFAKYVLTNYMTEEEMKQFLDRIGGKE